jgi:hypothetical protein
MNKEAFIKFYQLIKNDGQEPGKACEYIINRSNDFWKTTFVSRNAFKVFDENHDGVIDFAEFLFILASESNIDLATKYSYLFDM